MNEDETQAEDDAQPTDNRKLLLALLLLLLTTTKATLTELCAGYLAGHLTLLELHDGIVQTLSDAHSHAAYLGRQLAGDVSPFGPQDQQFSAAVMDGQAPYLEGLLNDFQVGRYAQGQEVGHLEQRLQLYAMSLRSTANASWSFGLEPQTVIHWVITQAEHCQGCLDMAAGNPYTAETLTKVPGDNECLYNCRCYLQIEDGAEGVPFMGI